MSYSSWFVIMIYVNLQFYNLPYSLTNGFTHHSILSFITQRSRLSHLNLTSGIAPTYTSPSLTQHPSPGTASRAITSPTISRSTAPPTRAPPPPPLSPPAASIALQTLNLTSPAESHQSAVARHSAACRPSRRFPIGTVSVASPSGICFLC